MKEQSPNNHRLSLNEIDGFLQEIALGFITPDTDVGEQAPAELAMTFRDVANRHFFPPRKNEEGFDEL